MQHIKFSEATEYSVALLCKSSAFNKAALLEYYIDPIQEQGVDTSGFIGFDLEYDNKKVSKACQKEYLGKLLPVLKNLNIHTLYVADSEYFKTLTGERKADPHIGSVLPCKLDDSFNVVLTINWSALFHNPNYQEKIDLANKTLVKHLEGNLVELGSDIIHSEYYPETVEDIAEALDSLHQYPELFVDIETYGLRHYSAGLGSIAFAWDEHNGIAFGIDFLTGHQPNKPVRRLLKQFLIEYKGNLVAHNCTFDFRTLIYQLWMEDITDQHGLLEGLEVMTRSFDDTKVIGYLATNSCAGNNLSLKDLAHSYVGNYAIDVKDIKQQSIKDLLKYNLIDVMATAWVKKEYYPRMVQDQQEELYLGLMKGSLKNVIHVELTGMPMCMDKVYEAEAELNGIKLKALESILSSSVVKEATQEMDSIRSQKDFEDRRAQAKNPEKTKYIERNKPFNPNSNDHLTYLLYTKMGLPVLDTTKTKLPATGAKEIKKLINHTDNEEYQSLIKDIIELSKVEKILSAFIPAFKEAVKGKDGIYYLFGNFNITGTVSGRLSSNNVNLQNLPSTGSPYAKVIKKCFKGNSDWLFTYADFNALESVIDALVTKDPAKLEILINRYDSHAFNSYTYWPHKFPQVTEAFDKIGIEDLCIDGVKVEENVYKKYWFDVIKNQFTDIRQASKGNTFALQYQGTPFTLQKNGGFSKEEAEQIYNNYHSTYKVSAQYTQDKIAEAAKVGYATVAFGLRVRTPLLHQSMWGSEKVSVAAQAEARTVGNALSQSYGMLNNRAMNAFMDRVYKSKYRYDIKPCALIHDCVYHIVSNRLDVIEWYNTNLIECMQWQELDTIKHPEVKLNAEVDLALDWSNAVTLHNKASMEDIYKLCRDHMSNSK